MAEQPINFIALREALLDQIDTLVPRWLPAGHQKGNYWYVGDFQGSAGKSANVNMTTGGWGDNGSDESGRDLISLYACIHGLSNVEAARELMEQLGWKSEDERGPVRRDSVQASAPPTPKPTKKPARWVPVVPVPKHAPPATLKFGYKDAKQDDAWVELEAVRSWRYEFEGQLYGHVGRYERVNSKGELVKDTITFTWCEDQDSRSRGTQRWQAKAWEEPRPLYVPAGLLSADCLLPVVIVEGEKCAEAGHQLLGHEFDFVSWPGGCQAWARARWGWIMGRTVILWPDCDAQRERLSKAERDAGVDPLTKPVRPEEKQPGVQAMVQLGTHLQASEGCSVSICKIPAPGSVAEGWDIADAIAEGWDAARVRDFLRGARTFVSPNDEARAKAATPPSDAGAGVEEGDSIAWRSKLIQAANGSIKPVRENVVLALEGQSLQSGKHLPGIPEAEGVIAFNEFTNNVEKLKPAPWKSRGKVWEEVEDLELGDWLSREHYLPSMSSQTLEEAVKMVAWRRRFHPVRERIQGLRGKWDQQPRLKNWLRRACLVDGGKGVDEPTRKYLARAGTWFLMALVARVMTPGCKFDYMLIFEGGQGMGKSTLAELLGLGWFADTGLTLGDKDSYQNLQGILVYEWGELQNLSKAEVGKVKLFIASKKDWFRASFDKRPREYPRQVVFIGTTNECHYLTDQTGNRRFWPVRVTRFVDLAWVRDNLDQLLAEALEKFEAGERFHPTFEEQRDLFDPQQMERTVEDSLEAEIRRLLYDEDQKVVMNQPNWSLVPEVSIGQLMEAMGVSVDKRTQVLTKQVSSVMTRLGWPRARASSKGSAASRPWVYRRPKDAPNAQAADVAPDDDFGGPTQGQTDEGADDGCPF